MCNFSHIMLIYYELNLLCKNMQSVFIHITCCFLLASSHLFRCFIIVPYDSMTPSCTHISKVRETAYIYTLLNDLLRDESRGSNSYGTHTMLLTEARLLLFHVIVCMVAAGGSRNYAGGYSFNFKMFHYYYETSKIYSV